MRPLIAAAALLAAGIPPTAWAAAPNDIIWGPPAAAGRQNDTAAKTGAPKTGEVSKETMTPLAGSAQPDKNGIIWNAPPVKASSAPVNGRVAQSPPSAEGPCREFQTTIVIDGKREPAHGTVCRQADGTWRVVNK